MWFAARYLFEEHVVAIFVMQRDGSAHSSPWGGRSSVSGDSPRIKGSSGGPCEPKPPRGKSPPSSPRAHGNRRARNE